MLPGTFVTVWWDKKVLECRYLRGLWLYVVDCCCFGFFFCICWPGTKNMLSICIPFVHNRCTSSFSGGFLRYLLKGTSVILVSIVFLWLYGKSTASKNACRRKPTVAIRKNSSNHARKLVNINILFGGIFRFSTNCCRRSA